MHRAMVVGGVFLGSGILGMTATAALLIDHLGDLAGRHIEAGVVLAWVGFLGSFLLVVLSSVLLPGSAQEPAADP